jgi:superfamily II DNA/RNA helicase
MTNSNKPFSDFNLHPQLQQAVDTLGFTTSTPIQAKCLPLIQSGQDIAGLAQTGTGKTAAYLIPLLDRILKSSSENEVDKANCFLDWQANNFIMVLVPTRELVTQVYENFKSLAQHTTMDGVILYGGVGYDEQKAGLAKPFQFLIATPGRLIDLYKEGFVDFKNVRGLVLDEADRMFDMGFQQDVFFILKRVPENRQLLMFSATLNFSVTEMAYQAHSNPVQVDVSRDKVTTENIEDFILHLGKDEKPKFLLSILKKYEPKQIIIFSNFKNNVGRIAQFLTDNGYPALGISSLITQAQRNRVIENFKGENKHNIMVATDVAARGLDIKGVDLVINYELPDDAENYVHRIGRTGRAEQKGKAFSFVSDKDVEALGRIEDYLKEKLEAVWLEDSDLVQDFKPLPADESRRFNGPSGGARGGSGDRNRNGGRRDSGGRGGNKSRPPRGDGRRPDRDNNRDKDRNKEKSAAAPTPGGSENKPQHRDRRTGRHQQKDVRNNNNDKSKTAGSTSGSGRNNNQKRVRRPFNPKTQNRPVSKAAAGSKGSLWSKIKTSVQKMIGK